MTPFEIAPIEYTIGTEPEDDPLAGYFFQGNACGLKETIEVTGLPASGFMQHRAWRRDFFLYKTEDVDDVGLYIVTIKGTIEAADTTFSDQISFELRVSPCQVEYF